MSVINLDQANLAIRTNEPGIYPSVDFSVSFKQLIFETCWDSQKALTDFVSSYSLPRSGINASDEKISSPTSPDVVNTFESVDQDAFFHSKGTYSDTQSFDLEMEDLDVADELEWHMDFESTLSKEDVLVDKVKVFSCATNFSLNKNFLNVLPELTPKSMRYL